MAKTNDFSYEVKKNIGELSDKIKLRIVSWNGNDGKVDLRQWWTDKDGNEKCGKGISLTNDEAKKLVDLLSEYLNDEDDDF